MIIIKLSVTDEAITSHCRSDLLASWSDGEGALRLESVFDSLLHETRRPTHVFVAAVRAASDKTWALIES